MSTENIEKKVIEIIADKLGADIDAVKNAASFTDDLGADSLDTVELIMAFEEAFDLVIPDEDAEKLITVQQVVDFIKKNAKGS